MQALNEPPEHCHLEIGNPNQTRPRPEIEFDSNEKEIIDSEIAHLLELGVIEPAVHSPAEYISTIFVRIKKSGKYRMNLNLKGLNKHIEKHHYKMDTLRSAVRLMTPNCFMASIDLKDAYYVVSIAEEHRKYLRFYWQGCLYQYTSMPNGLSSAPRCFTKLLKPVYSTLRQYGHLNVGYTDDSYLQGSDTKECLLNISDTLTLFTRLGFVINFDKSCLKPAQQITFLGFVLDSVAMTIALTDDKKAKVKATCRALLPKPNTTIIELAQLVGMLVSELLKMLIAIPFVLPKQEDLLSLSHSPRTLHPLRRKLTMLASLSGNPSRIEEFQIQLLSSSWPPVEMEQTIQYLHYKVANIL